MHSQKIRHSSKWGLSGTLSGEAVPARSQIPLLVSGASSGASSSSIGSHFQRYWSCLEREEFRRVCVQARTRFKGPCIFMLEWFSAYIGVG